MGEPKRRAWQKTAGGALGFCCGARNFALFYFIYFSRFLAATEVRPGGAGSGNPGGSGQSAALPPSPARPRPLLLPFGGGGGGGAGGQARGAGTKGSGTNTHLGPEQKAAAPAAAPILPGCPSSPCRRGPSPDSGDSRTPGAPSQNPTFSLLWR